MKLKSLSLLILLAFQHAHADVVIVTTPALTLNSRTTLQAASFSPGSPGGTQIVTAGGKFAETWDAATGKLLDTFIGHADTITSAQFAPYGTEVITASNDKKAMIWDVNSPLGLPMELNHKAAVRSATFSNHGYTVLTASGNDVILWQAGRGKEIYKFSPSPHRINSASLSPDRYKVAIALEDNSVQIWNMDTDRLFQVFQGRSDAEAFSPQLFKTLTGHTSAVLSVAFSRDGKYIVTASADGTAKIWEVETGALIRTLVGHTQGVTSAEFSPNGKYVLSACGDGEVRIWDIETGQDVIQIMAHAGRVNSAQFSPDGTKIVTASNDKTAKIWDVGQILKDYEAKPKELKKPQAVPQVLTPQQEIDRILTLQANFDKLNFSNFSKDEIQRKKEDLAYKIFNLVPGSSQDEIKKVYKKLALQLHPDKNPDPQAKPAFQIVNNAYSALTVK